MKIVKVNEDCIKALLQIYREKPYIRPKTSRFISSSASMHN